MIKNTVTSRDYFCSPTEIPHGRHEQIGVGRNGDRIVVPEVEDRCKIFGTIPIPSITTTLKYDFLFINVLLLLYKLSGGGSEIERYTGSGVWHM